MAEEKKRRIIRVYCEIITEDPDFDEGAVRAELELFEKANSITIENIKVNENTL